MPHFYVPPENIRGSYFWLNREESEHVARVLRKQPGEEIQLFDGADRSFRGVLETVTPSKVDGRVVAEEKQETPRYRLRLFQVLPKGDKMEWILEKGTELGIHEFVPVNSERSVGRVPAERLPARLERWEKIIRSAAQQCGRTDLPRVQTPLDWNAALARIEPDQWTFLPWESAAGTTLKAGLEAFRRERAAALPVINVIIGPEGGLSPDEVARAEARGARTVTLGPRILRTETAGLAAAAAFLYELGND